MYETEILYLCQHNVWMSYCFTIHDLQNTGSQSNMEHLIGHWFSGLQQYIIWMKTKKLQLKKITKINKGERARPRGKHLMQAKIKQNGG